MELPLRPPRQGKNQTERAWYAKACLANGWSRVVLVHQIEIRLIDRQGQAQTNFERTLPPPQSDLAQTALKDPYSLDFLDMKGEIAERELERGLISHLRSFLLELGVGFAYMGRQHRLTVGDRDFYLDLLFYHVRLRCFVVIELKTTRFEPEHVGKLNFYLEAIDRQLRHPDDRPSIGLLLCKERDRTVVEYSLRQTNQPIGVADYRLTRDLPEELQAQLPSWRLLKAELETGSQPPTPAVDDDHIADD